MSTITQISTAIKALIATLTDVDQSSIDSYLPTATTQKVALVMPPMGLRGTVDAPVGRKTKLVHRIPCEFWVKVHNNDLPTTVARAREICLNAAAEVQASLTLGGLIDYLGDGGGSPAFEWAIDDNMINLGHGTYIRGTLFVTVTEWVVLEA